MDNFDIRKYITEAKLSEQKKAYIKYEDGSTEDRMFHQSVSDSKIKKMFAPGTFIDGKKVLKLLVGDSLDQPINEAEEGYNEILQWAEENLNFELSDRMLDDIQNILDDGVPVKVIKKMLSDPTGSRLNEEKDVIEPEEGAEKKDNPDTKTVNKTEVISSVEKKLASLIKNAYDDEEPPEIPKSEILIPLKNLRSDTDYYSEVFDEMIDEYPDNPVEESLDFIITKIIREYLRKKIDDTDPSSPAALAGELDELVFIFKDYVDWDDMMYEVDDYWENKNNKS